MSFMKSKKLPILLSNSKRTSNMQLTKPSTHLNPYLFHKNPNSQFKFLNNQKLHKFPKKKLKETFRKKNKNHLRKNPKDQNLQAQDQETLQMRTQWTEKMVNTESTEVADIMEKEEDQKKLIQNWFNKWTNAEKKWKKLWKNSDNWRINMKKKAKKSLKKK